MGNLQATEAAYFGKEEKVMQERNRMDLVHALIILRGVRNVIRDEGEIAQALDTVFIQLDEMNLMLDRIRKLYTDAFGSPSVGL